MGTNPGDPTNDSLEYIGTPISVNASTTIKAIAYKAEMDPSEIATATYTIEIIPIITVDKESLSFTDIVAGSTKTEEIIVEGENLSSAISIEITGNNASFFSVDKNELAASGGALVVSYLPLSAGSHTATLTLTSGTATATVALSGNAILAAPTATAATAIGFNTFTANWNAVTGADEYELNVYTKTTNLVINGDFANGNNNWVSSSSSQDVMIENDGYAIYNTSGTSTQRLEQEINVEIGKTYIFSFYYNDYTASNGNGLKNYSLIDKNTATSYIEGGNPAKLTAASTWTRYERTFTATADIMKVSLRAYESVSIDNISVIATNVDIPNSPFTVTGTSKAITGLAEGTNYFYTVKATATGGYESAVSNEIAVTTVPDTIHGLYTLNNDLDLTGKTLTIAPDGQLTVTGTLTSPTATNLVIESDNTGTGSLLHSNAGVNATIERYITGGAVADRFNYHLISLPLAVNPTLAMFQVDATYLWSWEAGEWKNIHETTTTLDNHRGYLIYNTEASTYEFEGALNQGNFTISSETLQSEGNFKLIPNPYPSALNWDTVAKHNESIVNNAIHYMTATAASGYYASYVNGVPVPENANAHIIPVGQATFITIKDATSNALTLTNAMREHNTQAFYKNTKAANNVFRVYATTEKGNPELAVRLHDAATDNFDGAYDAYYIKGFAEEAPELYTKALDGSKLAINSIAYDDTLKVIPLHFECKEGIAATLTFGGFETFENAEMNVYLEDVLSGERFNLRKTDRYAFNYSKNDESHRFNLLITDRGIASLADTKEEYCNIWASKGILHITFANNENLNKSHVELYDVTGRLFATSALEGSHTVISDINYNGPVMVRVVSNNGVYTQKVILTK
jgi:hypothetical protein